MFLLLRRIVERLSRNLVLRRELPPEFARAPLFVTPGAGLRYFYRDLGKVDPLLLRMARELVRRGDVVWDVGANIGLFTVAAASLAGSEGTVLAVEPDPWVSRLLRRSAELPSAGRARIEVLTAAVADRIGVAPFYASLRSRAYSHLEHAGNEPPGEAHECRTVETITLDSLLDRLPPPRVLKIDVEGAEADVLAGSQKLLSQARPLILCEVSEVRRQEVTNRLRVADYTLWEAALQPLERYRRDSPTAPWDTLALPRERVDEFFGKAAQTAAELWGVTK